MLRGIWESAWRIARRRNAPWRCGPSLAGARQAERWLLFETLEARMVLSAAVLPGLDELVIDSSQYHPSRILVGLRPGADAHGIGNVAKAAVQGMRPLMGGLWEFHLGGGTSVETALAAVRANPLVAYAEPDYTVRIAGIPGDPQFSSLWGLNNTGQTGGASDADIDAPEAWDLTTGSGSTIVAVIDTGVDYRHADLAANIWTNPGEIPGDGIDNEGNGFVDDVHGYDFINNDPVPLDDHGHGTHVAGTIGAVGNNGVGVAGINWQVQIMALKFLSASGSGSTSDAIRALNYAVQMGAHVSNNSYGDAVFSQAFVNALEAARQAGHIFVAAAGNSSVNNDAGPFFPASYNAANVISVAATDHNDRLASFSNYGRTTVDLGAPGVNILSTTPNNAYGTSSGTSMASPHVAGVVSLVRGLHPDWTYQQVIDQVLNSVDFVPELEVATTTGGRLNAARAIGVPDTDGPRIISIDPAGATGGPVSSVRLSFHESVDPGSFSTVDITSFVGPGGSIAVTGVNVVAGSRNRRFEITFAPQVAKGAYEMVLGPSIFDTAGNPMNQDGDTTNGEIPADQYTASLVIGDVHVLRSDNVPTALSPFTTSSSTLTFDQDLSIADLNVQVKIDYPDAGLLGLTLVSPGGTRVTLAATRGFLGPNYDDTIFDDEASQSIGEGSPPYAGSYRPASPLSIMDNTSTLGTWRLEVSNPWFDSGTLRAWSLLLVPHPPRVSITDVTVAEGDVGDSSATFTVSLSNVIGDAVTVKFATADGVATAGSDYEAASGTLTFAPGELTKSVTVVVHGDSLDEPDESLFLNLSNAANANLADSQGMATIRNDEARLSISDVTLVEGHSGTSQAVFVVRLLAASSQTISVAYATANGTAAAGSDYVAVSGALTFAPGEMSKTIVVTVNGDARNEPDETFLLNLSGEFNALIDDSQGRGTITDDDPMPALSINDIKLTEGNSGVKNLNFSVSLSAASGGTVSADYTALAGTATPGADFTAASGTITFLPGQSSKTITIVVSGDTLPEADETFLLRLSNPAGAFFLDAEGLGTIQNDDTSLSISDATLSEEDTGLADVAFTVTLSTPVDFEVRVNFATASGSASAGSDYVNTGGTLIFSPGETSQTVSVLSVHDRRDEPDETFFVNLTNPVSALVADGQGVATIADNDPLPSVSISDPNIVEGNSGTRTLNFTVSLSSASGRTVTVQYATVDGTATSGGDYVSKSGTLTFPAGSVSQPISITVNGDTAAELDEALLLTLSNPSSAVLVDNQAQGTILEDDNLSISNEVLVEGNSGAASALVTISLAIPLTEEVRLEYATANGTAAAGSDYAAVSGTLVLPPGTTFQTIVIPVIGDRSDEDDETFVLNLTNPVNVLLSDSQALVTITDDDPLPVITVSDAAVVEGSSSTKNLSFTVSLSAVSGRTVTVQYATADGGATAGSDYVARSGTLTFSPGNNAQTFNVTLIGDTAIEPSETLLLNLISATNAIIGDSQGVGTIANDDPLPVLSIGDAKVTEGNAGTKTLSLNVTLSATSTNPVTVDYAMLPGTAMPGSDFTAASGTLTFNPGQSSKSVTVTIAGDAMPEADETFLVNLSNPTGAVVLDGEAVATIQNDDTSLHINDAIVTEGSDGLAELTFVVSLATAVDFEVSANFFTANGSASSGSDYVTTSGTLIFAAGQTSQSVTVLVLNDLRDEPDETFYVNLASPFNAQLADSQGLATIVDNTPLPSLSITGATIFEGNSGTKNLNFTVRLSAISGRNVTVQYTTADGTALAGSDYQARSGTLTLLSGWNVATISVPLSGDTAAEFDETLLVMLTNPTNAVLAVEQAQGTILDDDNLSFSDIVLVEGDSGATYAAFTVALTVPLAKEMRFDYATANGGATAGSDYLATAGTVVLAAGATSQTILVPVLSDRMDEPDETIILNFSNPVNVLLVDTQAVATITDDDQLPGLSVDDVTVAEGNSGTKNLTFTVRLSVVSGRTVMVQYATSDDTASAGSDYVSKSGTLSFPPGWLVQTITVPFNGDVEVEFDERFLINLAAPLNAVIDDGQAAGRLLNDDDEGGTSASNLVGDALVVKLPGTKAGPQPAKERTASVTTTLVNLSLDTALLAIIAELNGSITDGKRRK